MNQNAVILIVDDNLQNIQVLGTTLMQCGYQIHVAQNGLQALEKVEAILPDLILLDVMMPELDGWKTCERLKQQASTREIPVIFLTARTDSEDIVKGFELGAVDYIAKPFNAKELLARVNNHLKLVQLNNERKELLHILCHDLVTPVGTVVSTLELLENEHGIPQEMYDLLLAAAHSGLETIDLVRQMRALEEQKLTLSPINLASAVENSVTLLRNRFKQKNIDFDIQVDPQLKVLAEPISLVNSVLNNLYTNAIKFSYPNSIIRTYSHLRQDHHVELHVQDFGIGIPDELQRALFDWRRNRSRTGTAGEHGTGFGMPMVKKFMATYGGKIVVSSNTEPDNSQRGTTITLIFSLVDA